MATFTSGLWWDMPYVVAETSVHNDVGMFALPGILAGVCVCVLEPPRRQTLQVPCKVD